MTERWIAFGVACLVVAAAAFGAGAGTVALFSDTETMSGSFSVADEHDGSVGPWSENGTANDSQGDVGNGSDAGGSGNGTAPPNGTNGGNGTTGGNDTTGGNGTTGENDTTGGNGSAPNGTAGENGTAPNGSAGGNDSAAGGNETGGDDGNDTDGDAGGASVAVTSVDLAASEVAVGEDGGVVVTVQNDGSASASFTASLTVDGSETASGTIDLAPGEQSTLSLQHTFQSSGNYTLGAAGVVAGTVEVVGSAGNATASDG